MKDYRLSEIQNHNWNELWDLSDDIAKRRIEFVFLRNAQYSLEHLDIEPRDMIELPCKIATPNDIFIDWQVIWRTKEGGCIGTKSFDCEAKADAFLAELKGDRQ